MLKIERRERIKDYLVKNEFADIKVLAEMLEVSTATVRRHLKELEDEDLVEMSHGGATLAKKGHLYEHPYKIKRQMHQIEKGRIAKEAIKFIRKNDSIFLDSSSTVFEVTRFLNKFHSINVATNDIMVAESLTNIDTIDVSVIGGSLRKHYYTLTGFFTESILKDLSFDLAILGIDTLSLKSGLMITNVEEVQIKRMVINSASKVIVLADHSKFEKDAFLNVCGFEQIDLIITGKELAPEIYKKYVDFGVNLLLV